MSKVLKITLFVLTGLLLILAGITFALRTKRVQHWLINKVADYLSTELNTKVSLSGVNIRFFDKADLLDLYIEDQHGDTLFYFQRLGIKLNSYNSQKRFILLDKLELIGTKVHFYHHVGTKGLNYKFIEDYFNNQSSSGGGSWVIKSKKVILKNSDFLLWDKEEAIPQYRRFNEYHIHFQNINAKLNNFVLVDDSIRFKSESFSCTEKSGLQIENLVTDATIWSKGMVFDSLLLQTRRSTLKNKLVFDYRSYAVMDDFNDSVNLSVNLKDSKISVKDLAYFTDDLIGLNYIFNVSGNAKGTIRNFKSKDLNIQYGKNTQLVGAVDIKGLPDVDNSFFKANIKSLNTNMADARLLMKSIDLPEEFDIFGNCSFNGQFTGFLNDFVAFGDLQTEVGNFKSDINMKIPDKGPEVYSGNLVAEGFDVGAMYDVPNLGLTSFNVTISGSGFKAATFEADVEGNIVDLDWNGYSYSGLSMDGRIEQKQFVGKAAIQDQNIDFSFLGNIDFNKKIPEYDFTAILARADLKALKLDTINSKLSTLVNVQLRGDKLDNLSGSAKASNLSIERGEQKFFLKETTLFSALQDRQRTLIFNSDIADFNIQGDFMFSNLNRVYKEFVSTLFPEYYPALSAVKTPVSISFSSTIKRPDIVSKLFNTSISMSPGFARGDYNSTLGSLRFWSNLDSLRYDDVVIKNWDLNLRKEPGELLNLSTEAFNIEQSGEIRCDYLLFNASILPNYIDFTLLADDKTHNAHLFSFGHSLFTKDSISINFEDGKLSVYDKTWKIDNENQIDIYDGNVKITDFVLQSKSERLDLNGYVYKDSKAEISLWLRDFNLQILSPFISSSTIDKIAGVANGTLNVSGKWYEPLVNSDLIIEDLSLNKDTLGNFKLISKARGNDALVMDIYCTMQEGLLKDLEIEGNINLAKSAENLDLKLIWRNGKIKPLEQFFEDVASDFKGNLSAVAHVSGTFNDPKFTGTAYLDSCSFLVDYTNVRYALKGSLLLTEKKFSMNYMEIFDQPGSQGQLTGVILHDLFDNFYLDLRLLHLENFLALNTKKGDNELFWGTAYLDGSCLVKGDLDDIYLNINAKSRKGTKIYIPLEWESDNSSVSYINFAKPEENSAQKLKRKVDLSGISMDFNFELTPDAYIEMIFDELMDDRIKGNGYGNLKMEINTYGDFSMYGDYIIETGQYHFTALNFISKEFNIKNGSKISWDGNPYDGKMNIEAVKRENAAPADLLVGLVPAEQLQNYRTKIPVDCQLFLKGLLFSPDIAFGLSFPNQNSVSSLGFNAFNSVVSRIQSDPEELNRQVFSLLVLGSFIPPSFSSGSSLTATSGFQNTVNNSVGDLISNQVSNWISQLDDRWQIGIDWQSASEATKKELIFSVKRKFLNDRLEFDGSVDANAINGRNPYNLNIQYNITSDGRFKVRGFSKFANDPTLGVVSNIYTTGVGFSYRKQFNKFTLKKKKPIITQPIPAIKPKDETIPTDGQ